MGWQLLRAGTSIGANVEEAQAGQSKADFISKNAVALKESRETEFLPRKQRMAKNQERGVSSLEALNFAFFLLPFTICLALRRPCGF